MKLNSRLKLHGNIDQAVNSSSLFTHRALCNTFKTVAEKSYVLRTMWFISFPPSFFPSFPLSYILLTTLLFALSV